MSLNGVAGGRVVGLQRHFLYVVAARPNTDLGFAKSEWGGNFGQEQWKH